MKKKSVAVKNQNYCKHCNKTIIGSSYKFKSHLFKHNAVEARFKCKYCSKAYYRYDTFVIHEKSHVGVKRNDKKYVCDYCDRSFVNKFNLIVHLKKIHDDSVNTDRIRFSCDACGVHYCEKRSLDNHIRKIHFNLTHHPEPAHITKSVNESWIERVNIRNTCVLITKVNSNVITIEKCGKIKEFTQPDTKCPDKTSYEKQFVDQYSRAICDYCQKEMLKKSLKNHITERHLDIRKYRCSDCGRSFKRHYQYTDHKCNQIIIKS
ncbi:zinc finger protein 41 [Danaus plexippus plexippus]|uniref:Zinc finger protein 41 n=1 Tax=Danaus plexippus plexippus TaxID=278856 RepID=A0A212EZ86_DANPL|nr:zinc finger imprinted 3-like [Danaus plexippus plexippus]XP_032528111.1 zinc finger imprinted 3-like [Danaus plexippus plexippus]OWR46802.1 zinc finger protein 41 [Danaus plexippus plexippus]